MLRARLKPRKSRTWPCSTTRQRTSARSALSSQSSTSTA